MKTNEQLKREEGSVLVTTFLTLSIVTMVCATSLYITSQNATGAMQTASWQQALTGAESGVDTAIRALNRNDWTGWKVVASGTPGPVEPTSTTVATATPGTTGYNYLPSTATSIPLTGEGIVNINSWVTVDQAGMLANQDSNGKQWFRIRSTGHAGISGPLRVAMNKLDNNLRNTVSLNFARKPQTQITSSNAAALAGPTRTIEVIMQPLLSSGIARAITLKEWISMSGGGTVDSFNSGDPFESSTIGGVLGQYDSSKRQSHGDVGTLDSASSDLRNTFVYGHLSYSGTTPVKNTTNVQGGVSTPFAPTVTTVSAPNWAGAGIAFTSISSGNPGTLVAGQTPTYYKMSGDLTVSGGGILHLNDDGTGVAGQKINIWVTGKFTTSGSGQVDQASNVKVTWYIGGDITCSGSSYNNRSGLAANMTMNGYGSSNKFTDSGSAAFVGIVNAPGYDATISGTGSFIGALIADTLTISGGASFHYDEALSDGATSAVGNYSFASWFEDNSDPARLIAY